MAVIAPTLIYDETFGGSVRLRGNLAAGAVLTQGNIYRERIRMPVSSVALRVRCVMVVTGGVPTLQLVPQTANIQTSDLTVSDVTTGLATSTPLVTNVEASHVYLPKGEMFVDVVLDCTGQNAAGTVTYADVSAQLTGEVGLEGSYILQELRIQNELLVQGLNIPVDVDAEYRKDPAYKPIGPVGSN